MTPTGKRAISLLFSPSLFLRRICESSAIGATTPSYLVKYIRSAELGGSTYNLRSNNALETNNKTLD